MTAPSRSTEFSGGLGSFAERLQEIHANAALGSVMEVSQK
jgi:hypothetical protein